MKYLKREKGFYRSALLLMLPMIMQNLITNVMALADMFMVGALGENSLAAVSLANSPFFVMMLVCFGLQSGSGVLTAQYYGKGDTAAINRVVGMGLYASLTLSAILAVLSLTIPGAVMRVLTDNESLVGPGVQYMRFVGPSFLFVSVTGIYLAAQRSMGNPKLGAVLLTASGLLNIFLNWVLIFGKFGAPAMGVAGAALATLLSRGCETAAVTAYALWIDKRLKLRARPILRPGKKMFRDGARYILPVVLNETLWSLGMSLYSLVMGHMEDSAAILAAYSVSGNLERLLSVGLFAAGGATAVIIGRDIGAGDAERVFDRSVALCALSAAVGVISGAAVIALRFTLANSLIFPLMGLGENARGYGCFMLTAVAVILPLRALNLSLITGVFRSGGDVRFALFCDVLPMLLLCVPASAIFGLVLKAGLPSIYLCICAEDVIKIVFSLHRLKTRRWIHNVTREDMG